MHLAPRIIACATVLFISMPIPASADDCSGVPLYNMVPPIGPELRLDTGAAGHTPHDARVAASASGGVVVAWIDANQILIRQSNDHGATFGPITAFTGSSVMDVAMSPSGTAYVVWIIPGTGIV